MGRKVVEATKAWRMRRTRGDIGRFLRFAVAAWGKAVRGFLVDCDEDVDFGCAALGVGFVEAAGVWSVDVDFLLEESEVAGGETFWGNAIEYVLLSSPQRTLSASSHRSLRPNRTTFNVLARERRNLCIEMLEMI
jgi:hypothetical protein